MHKILAEAKGAGLPNVFRDSGGFTMNASRRIEAPRARWRRASVFAAVSAVSIAGAVSTAFGNADSWKTATSGAWGVGTNWVDGTTPGNSDTANFNVFGSYTVTFSAAPL